MKNIKKNAFMMIILAVAIIILFLGSVSADETNDANLTVNDNSCENSELNVENIDDTLQSNVNDDILKSSSTPELRDKSTGSTDVIIKSGNEVTIEANMEYDYWSLQMSRDGSSYSMVKYDTGHAYWYDLYTFTPESGIYYFKVVNYYDRYGSPSNVLKYTVKTTDETETSISINPATVVPNGHFTITPTVYKKGTNTKVETGTVEFFYGDDISIGTLNLATQKNFTYSGFSSENTYSIYAIYKANENYEQSTSAKMDILVVDSNSNINFVKVEISDVMLPDQVVVNLTANLTGTYRIFFNSTEYIDIEIVNSNQKVSKNHTLKAGYYNTSVVPQFSSDYLLSQTNAKFNVYSINQLNANLTIREANNLDKDSEVTLTADNSYDFNLVYWLDKPDANIKSDKLICYISTQDPTETTQMSTGGYTTFISTSISSSGSVTFKLVYNATLDDDSVFIKESNELTVIFEINEVVSSVVQIRDKSTGNKGTIVINEDTSLIIQYYIVKPESTWISGEKIEIYINGVKNKTISKPSYDTWADAIELVYTESGDVSVQAIFTADGFPAFNVEDIYEQSNTLTYDINLNEEEIKTITIESDEINYGVKANLTVRGSDGEYNVRIDKIYHVNVINGVGYVITDVLEANKTYDVEIISSDDATLKNTSKLKVNRITPSVTVDATSKEYVYGELTTITVGKNTTAHGDITVYDNGELLTELENIKLAAGIHNIKAKYIGDNNFTDDEVILIINVTKQANELKLTVTNETYPDNVSVTLNATLSGDYTIFIGNNNYTITVGSNGIGVKSIQVKTGNHTAIVSYGGNQNYSSNSVLANFSVYGSNIGLKVTPEVSTIKLDETVEFNTSCSVNDADSDLIFKSDDGWQATAKIGEIVKYTPKTAGNHVIDVTYEDSNYNPQTVTVSVFVNKKTNNIKVEVSNSTYPENVSVKVTADISGNYTVNINGTDYIIESGKNKSIQLDAGKYCAKIIYENETYDANATNATFKVLKGINNVVISALNSTLPDQVMINVTADKSGNYTIRLDDSNNVTVNVLTDNGYGFKTVSLPANNYELSIINYDNKNYDISSNKVNITVFPQPLSATLEIRDGNKIGQNTITGDLIYSFLFEYKLNRPDTDFTSEKITVYCNDIEYYTITDVKSGDFVNIGGNLLLRDVGEYEFKAVWTATTQTDSYNQTSNTIKFNIVSKPSSILTIRDVNYKDNSTITLTGSESVLIEFSYLLERENTNYYLYEKNLTVFVNGESIGSTGNVADGFYANISLPYTESGDINVYLTFVGKDYLPTNYNEVSNVLTYHIIIGDESSDYLIAETNSVDETQNASVTVKSNVNGNYTVNIGGKDYNITLINGKGTIIIDSLKAGSYDVTVTSKDNSSFTNKTTLVIRNFTPLLEIEALQTTYPNNATLKVKSNKIGEYIINVSGKEYNVTLQNNQTTLTIDILPAGVYDVYVRAKNNESFKNQTILNITKGTNNIKLIIDNIVYLPEKVNITLTSNVDGKYSVNINGTSVEIDVVNGTGNNSVQLDEGVYFASISDSGIDYNNYTVVKSNKTFTVAKKQDVISIKDATSPLSVIDIDAEGKYNIQIDYLLIKPDDYFDLENLYMIINNQYISITPIVYGSYVRFEYEINESGVYNVQFNYSYMKNAIGLLLPSYLSNTITYDITLKAKTNESVIIDVKDINYPESINVSVKSTVNGDYWIYINETRYNITISNHSGFIIIDNLKAGYYKATLTLKSNESVKNTTTFTIRKANPNFEVVSNQTDNMQYGDKLKISYVINTNASGNISIYDNNICIAVTNVGGQFESIVLPSGNHTLEVRYSGDENFTNSKSPQINVYIHGLINNMELNISNSTYPNNVSVKIKATLNGKYNLTIGNKTFNIIVLNNEYETSLKIPTGNYSAYLTYAESNSSYESVTVSTKFNVKSNNIGLHVNVSTQKTEVGKTVKLNTISDAGYDGEIIFVLPNSTEIKANIGEEIDFIPDTIGKQIIKVIFNGDEIYSPENTNITIEVYNGENLIENVLTINNPTDSTNTIFSINLENASGILSVIVDGVTYSEVLSNGQASVEITDLEVGNHTAHIIYSGDGNYPRSELTTTFKVNKIQTSIQTATTIQLLKDTQKATLTVLLASDAGGCVLITIDGNLSSNLTLTDGKATFTTQKLNEGNHSILLSYTGDSKYENSTFETSLMVYKPVISQNKDMNVLYKSGSLYSVYITGSDGKALTSAYVNFNINGVASSVKTDSKGYASFKITQIPGTYTISVSVGDVSVSNKIVVKHLLSSKNIKVKKSSKSLKIKVSLLKVNGKYLKSKKITLKFKGKKYTAKTNKKGVANFNIKKNVLRKLKTGKYTYTVSYLKDKLDKKIIVKK